MTTAATALAVALLAALAVSRLVYPYDAGHYEGLILAPAALLVEGTNPYALDLATAPPYVVSGYGPVYYLVVGLGIHLFGPTLWFGRLAAIGAAAACLALVVHLGRVCGASPRSTWVAAGLFASCSPVQAWVGLQRPDFLALAASLGALALALSSVRAGRPSRGFVAGALIGIALATRQTMVGGMAAAGLVALSSRSRGTVPWMALGVVATGVIPLAVLNATSNGGLVAQMWSMPAGLPRSWAILAHHLAALAQAPALWAGGALVLAYVGRCLKTESALESRAPAREVALGWLVSALAAVATATIPGSNVNYFLEAAALGCCLAALGLECAVPPSLRARAAHIVSLVVFASAVLMGGRFVRGEFFRWQARPYYDALVAALRRVGPPDEPCHSMYPELAIAAGRPYYINTMSGYEQSERLRRVRDELLRRRVLVALVWPAAEPPEGYRRLVLEEPLPDRIPPAYLHVRAPLASP